LRFRAIIPCVLQEQQPLLLKDYYRQLPDHPGIDPLSLMCAPAESFEEFQTFVNTRGLNPKTKRAFSSLLADLFKRTGNLWLPGYCAETVELATQARNLVRQHIPIANVKVMLYPNDPKNLHAWTRLDLPDQPSLTIDPAGVLESSKILPYFGPTSPCLLNGVRLKLAEQIYLNSMPLSPIQENKLTITNKKHFPT